MDGYAISVTGSWVSTRHAPEAFMMAPVTTTTKGAPLATAGDAERETLEAMLVRLPADLREQVRERATVEERTQAQVVRRALRHYLREVPA